MVVTNERIFGCIVMLTKCLTKKVKAEKNIDNFSFSIELSLSIYIVPRTAYSIILQNRTTAVNLVDYLKGTQ